MISGGKNHAAHPKATLEETELVKLLRSGESCEEGSEFPGHLPFVSRLPANPSPACKVTKTELIELCRMITAGIALPQDSIPTPSFLLSELRVMSLMELCCRVRTARRGSEGCHHCLHLWHGERISTNVTTRSHRLAAALMNISSQRKTSEPRWKFPRLPIKGRAANSCT